MKMIIKNKTKNLEAIFLVATLLILTISVSALESCYVEFTLNENLIELIEFNENYFESLNESQQEEYLEQNFFNLSLDYFGLENLYGMFHHSVFNYEIFGDQMSYSLGVYNSNQNEIGRYSFETGLIIFYDSFEEDNPGGMEILNNSQTSIIIPYNSNIAIARVYMNDELKLEFQPTGMFCQRTCLIEEEYSSGGDQRCCIGLTRLKVDGQYTCVNCGDGICSEYETYLNCPLDCDNKEELKCMEGFIRNRFGCVLENKCGNFVFESENDEECDLSDGCSVDCLCNEGYEADGLGNCSVVEQVIDLTCQVYENYVSFEGENYFNSCSSNKTLVEYYCGINLLRWDFWNALEKIAKTRTINCGYGCFDGRCLDMPVESISEPECSSDSDCLFGEFCFSGVCVENPECFSDSDCGDFSVCSQGSCVLDLPDEPWKLQ